MMKINSKILGIVILATFFGLLSGVVGTLLTRVYILEESFGLPLFGEINLSSDNYKGSNIVISNPKKVVVEQDDKVMETVKIAKSSIVGIFKKNKNVDKNVQSFNINNYYQVDDKIGQGMVITSDGWIISSFVPQELVGAKTKEALAKAKQQIAENYVIITDSKKVYPINDIVLDELASYSFWRIVANDLTVKGFASRNDINQGQTVIGVNWNKEIKTAVVYGIKEAKSVVRQSDNLSQELVLSNDVAANFEQGFFFNLNGDLVALVDSEKKVRPIYGYTACINCLLNGQPIRHANLGVNYIDLSHLVPLDGKTSLGAMIVKNGANPAVKKGSPADISGLKEGDIITAINNISLDEDNDLAQIISQYKYGDEAVFIILRNKEKMTISVKLGGI